jgi:hypothetical protein
MAGSTSEQLGFKLGSEGWFKFLQFAAVEVSHIPAEPNAVWC